MKNDMKIDLTKVSFKQRLVFLLVASLTVTMAMSSLLDLRNVVDVIPMILMPISYVASLASVIIILVLYEPYVDWSMRHHLHATCDDAFTIPAVWRLLLITVGALALIGTVFVISPHLLAKAPNTAFGWVLVIIVQILIGPIALELAQRGWLNELFFEGRKKPLNMVTMCAISAGLTILFAWPQNWFYLVLNAYTGFTMMYLFRYHYKIKLCAIYHIIVNATLLLLALFM